MTDSTTDRPPALPAAEASETGWHARSPEAALAALATDHGGLDDAAVDARYAAFGPNRLPRRQPVGLLTIYLRQFQSPLVYLLLAATAVALAIGEYSDAAFIFIVLQLNAAIGTRQEHRAETGAAALDALVPNVTVVIRNGAPRRIDAAELVPGDIVRLESGTRVPADMRLVEAAELSVDESLLTGESLPIEKEPDPCDAAAPVAGRTCMLYAGTMVRTGRARAVVTATGARTEVGRIASAIAAGAPVPPPLMVRLHRFGRVIGLATLGIIAAMAAIQLFQGLPLATVFMVAVALAVAAIPEGLPVAITVALSIATHRMAARHVIVRALPAVEGLGACTLIASDKTGTLTCNELTVKRVMLLADGGPGPLADIGGEGYVPEGDATIDGRALTETESAALRAAATTGALCNEASITYRDGTAEPVGDTVDIAFLVLAQKLWLDSAALAQDRPLLGRIHYEPHKKFAAVFTHDPDGTVCAHVKGAAETLLPMCGNVDADAIHAAVTELAAEGYRVLALASGPVAMDDAAAAHAEALSGLRLTALACLIDPVRPEVPPAVQQCRRAGIEVRMITGDHPATALAIARELDIATDRKEVLTGTDLAAAADEAALDAMVSRARVFARVEPVQKLTIVSALQRAGHVITVTGDGVNDAPALSRADIGIAMGQGGTDAARDAADLILTDDNFASIVAGIEEGRIAYDNVRKVINLLVATGLGEIVLFLLSILAGIPVPLNAVQLLWLNLVTNGIQDVALAFERGEPGVLDRGPRPPAERLFDPRMIAQVATGGAYMGAAAFAFYLWTLSQGLTAAAAGNLVLLLMVLFENAHALNARSEGHSVFAVPFRNNPFLIVAILAAQAIHVAAMHLPVISDVLEVQPIEWRQAAIVILIGASLIVAMEVFKAFAPWRNNRTPRRHGAAQNGS